MTNLMNRHKILRIICSVLLAIVSIYLHISVLGSFPIKTAHAAISKNRGGDEFEVIARINNEVITRFDLEKRWNFVKKTSGARYSRKITRSLKKQLLQKMIDERLQFREAARLELKVSNEELMSEVENIAHGQNLSLKRFRAFFRHNGLSFNDYLEQIRVQILWSKIIISQVRPKISVSDAQAEELLEQYTGRRLVESFNISEIYLPFSLSKSSASQEDTKRLAKKLVMEIAENGNFEQLARQFSQSATAKSRGKIGWIDKGEVNKAIYNAVSRLEIGAVTSPIKIENGYYIFRLNDKKKRQAPLPKERLERAKKGLLTQKLQTEAQSYLSQLRRNSFIEVNF